MKKIQINCPVTEGNITHTVTQNIPNQPIITKNSEDKNELKFSVSVFNTINTSLNLNINRIEDLLTEDVIYQISKHYGFINRQRVIKAIDIISELIKYKIDIDGSQSDIVISQMMQEFKLNNNISHTAIHKQMGKPELVNVLKHMTELAMKINYNIIKTQSSTNSVLLQNAIKNTECTSIVHVDGTEISAHPDINKHLERKGKGRKRNKNSQKSGHCRSSSSDNTSTLKAHLILDSASSNILACTITHGTHSERDALLDNIAQMKKSQDKFLFVCDRGYYSKELSNVLDEAGMKYVLRLKKNSCLRIVEAVDTKGNIYPDLVMEKISGQKCCELVKQVKILDCKVCDTSDSSQLKRVVLKFNDNKQTQGTIEDNIMFLITNLSK